MEDLPLSLRKAAEIVRLPDFLEDVAVGFHWDILDRLEDGVYLVDRERRIMYWSAGAERITGYRAEDVLGCCCADNLLRHETFSDTSSLLAPLEKVRQLEMIAYIDGLTGIANRRLVEHEIENRFAEFRREGWVFGVILADVDHFKRFNDRHGHETGDRVLKMVANFYAYKDRVTREIVVHCSSLGESTTAATQLAHIATAASRPFDWTADACVDRLGVSR